LAPVKYISQNARPSQQISHARPAGSRADAGPVNRPKQDRLDIECHCEVRETRCGILAQVLAGIGDRVMPLRTPVRFA